MFSTTLKIHSKSNFNQNLLKHSAQDKNMYKYWLTNNRKVIHTQPLN